MITKHLLLSGFCCTLAALLAADGQAQTAPEASAKPSYAHATNGVLENMQVPGPSKWKLLIDESNLGGRELEVAEITVPAGTVAPSHAHGAVEIIYVLSGTYDHEVNGKTYRLKPGMLGIVRPEDRVRHLVPKDGDAKLLILWAPAGEIARAFSKAKGTTPAPVPELKQ